MTSEWRNWPQVVFATLGVAVSAVPVVILSFGVFIKPLGQIYGWGRGEISLALTILSFSMAASLPLAGRLIDRFGVKRVLVASLLVYTAALFAVPTFIETGGLWGLYAAMLVIGVVGAGSSAIAYIKVLSAWFDKSRGVVLGLAMSGVALGAAITPAVASALIQSRGWAAGFYGLALLPLVVALPIAVFGLREAPVPTSGTGARAGSAVLGMTAPEALRSGIFWSLFLLFLIAATAIHGIQIHLSPMLTDRGLSIDASVAAVSFMFIVSLVTRIGVGFLLDKLFAPYVGALCFALAAIGAALLAPDSTTLAYFCAAALLGVGAGGETDLLGYLVGRYFGLRAFGQIYGWIFGAFMAGSAIGPYMLGAAFDRTGSYQPALIGCAVGLTVAGLILLRLPRYPASEGSRAASDKPVAAPAE